MVRTDLDYSKIQNLLLGQALDDLRKQIHRNNFDQSYRLDAVTNDNTQKIIFLAAISFNPKQEITQSKEERMIKVAYLKQRV
jgi:hypothetical protein